MKVLALANSKGGTGKTSVSVHLAVGAALSGLRTLLVDLDPQGNATEWLTGRDRHEAGIADALSRGKFAKGEILAVPGRERLELAPASDAAGTIDVALARLGGQDALADVLEPLRELYDLVIVDCQGSLGMAVASAITVADAVLVPVSPPFFSLRGVTQLEEAILRARRSLGSRAEAVWHVLFAADSRKRITAEAREMLAKKGRLLPAEIRVSAAAEGIASHQRTAWDEGADERGAEDYPALLALVLERLKLRNRSAGKRRRSA